MFRALLLTVALTGCTLALPMQNAPEASGLRPDADGLQPEGTTLRIDFGRAQSGVLSAVARLFGGDPGEINTNVECGAGPVTAARWKNGLTLNFQDGALRGWVVDVAGIPVGTQGLEVGQAPPPVVLEKTSLGREFGTGGVFGLVDGTGQIALLWSGTTCFFR